MDKNQLHKIVSALDATTDWVARLKEVLADEKVRVSAGDTTTAKQAAEITLIHKKTTHLSNRLNYGFDDLLASLVQLPDSESLMWVTVRSDSWVGRCLVRSAGKGLIGCSLTHIKNEKKLVTPPDWDGTEERIQKFNKSSNPDD